MVVALILESAHQLDLPARTAFSRERARLKRLSLAANLALANEVDIEMDLNREYTFNKTLISTGNFFASTNGAFLQDVSCNTSVILSGAEGVNVTCVGR